MTGLAKSRNELEMRSSSALVSQETFSLPAWKCEVLLLSSLRRFFLSRPGKGNFILLGFCWTLDDTAFSVTALLDPGVTPVVLQNFNNKIGRTKYTGVAKKNLSFNHGGRGGGHQARRFRKRPRPPRHLVVMILGLWFAQLYMPKVFQWDRFISDTENKVAQWGWGSKICFLYGPQVIIKDNIQMIRQESETDLARPR